MSLKTSLYKTFVKPIFFSMDPHFVHESNVMAGEFLGKYDLSKRLTSAFFSYKNPRLTQEFFGITFENPIGLAAGFDYEARLTQILPCVGFGFHTAGTITNSPYCGNPMPMLGRLPLSRSLLVNKGFKNLGAEKTINYLSGKRFSAPFGISIGRTNKRELTTQKESVNDILECFTKFEKSKIPFSYYELNISCPNLYGDISFYPPQNLKELLREVDKLKIKRPIFVKMPIEKNDKESLEMLEIISKYSPKAVVFGNLQKDKNNKDLNKDEVKQFKMGNFSGKPTFKRSNELISLAFRHFKERFLIVGCGGVFSSEDAYEKMARGASLVQLITGMVYEGPGLISDINFGLVEKMDKIGVKNISEIVGSQNAG